MDSAFFNLIYGYLLPITTVVVSYLVTIYFLAKAKNSELNLLQKKLRVGDKVICSGGIVGTIFQKDSSFVILSTFDGSLIEVALQHVIKQI